MKTVQSLLLMALAWMLALNTQAQTATAVASRFSPGAELLLKGGVGFVKGGMPPAFGFNVGPATSGTIGFPKNKMGLNGGLDFNYYFNQNFGLSSTFDLFSNAYKTIEVSPPLNPAALQITQKNQGNKFVGLGPIARFSLSPKWSASTALYGGMLWHKKNSYNADYVVAPFGSTSVLNFSSNKSISAVAAKASLRIAYEATPNIGISAGVEYILPFFSKTQQANGLLHPSSTGYFVNPPRGALPIAPQRSFDSGYIRLSPFGLQNLEQLSKLSLLAINVAVKFRFGPGLPKVKKEKVAKKAPCCTTCPEYFLTVTARDKYTKEVLPNTDVAIKNKAGEVIKTAKTNAFGVVNFERIVKQNYTIEGLLNNVALENSSVDEKELICDETVQKEIIYADRNFIIKGKAVVCNSTTPIAGINVSLENKELAFKRSTMTDANGVFVLQLPETGTYDLYGRKESFFSQVEKVSASDYNREKTLFVQLEICAEKADCGTAINLKNILFDLDKYAIKEVAKKELDRLVQFMKDNPGVKVEVSSHTDCRSSNEYNNTLSQNRANASVDYVVSQGIERSRITGKGYGETKLLNRCADGVSCSEAEHAVNRRTEMKVVCPE